MTFSRKIVSFFLCAVTTACVSTPGGPARSTAADAEGRSYRNELRPFTSDGCSNFPNGIPYYDENKWRKCCVIHDISYWQGGTTGQRLAADEALRSCVAANGGAALAKTMYAGVRVGGTSLLPMTWRWGYGWTMDRGDRELTPDEKAQVDILRARIPENVDDIPIASAPPVGQRPTLTGNYCVDAAVKYIQLKLGRPFKILAQDMSAQKKMGLTTKILRITVDGCAEPFQFSFVLFRPNACETITNELVARTEIRLRALSEPRSCTTDSTPASP